MSEDELERLAREEIIRETQRASVRADEVGPQGWMKCQVPPANKRFLHNTLLSTLPSKGKSRSSKESSPPTASDRPKGRHEKSEIREREKQDSDTHGKRIKRQETKDERHTKRVKREFRSSRDSTKFHDSKKIR